MRGLRSFFAVFVFTNSIAQVHDCEILFTYFLFCFVSLFFTFFRYFVYKLCPNKRRRLQNIASTYQRGGGQGGRGYGDRGCGIGGRGCGIGGRGGGKWE